MFQFNNNIITCSGTGNFYAHQSMHMHLHLEDTYMNDNYISVNQRRIKKVKSQLGLLQMETMTIKM